MAKSPNQKLKLLYLVDILERKSDEKHPMTAAALIEELAKVDVSAERKSIYDDINQLIDYGYDIVHNKSRVGGGYYMASRRFELAELKVLVDSVQSSRFLSAKKTRELIEKLEQLCSIHEEKQLKRQVYVLNRIKTDNESIFYNVDYIHEAIHCNKQISFQYYEWSTTKEMKLKRDGEVYIASPLGLVWDDENYYLVAYEKDNGIRHYRVDKMKSISVLEESRLEESGYREFDPAVYSNKVFGMYGGDLSTVTLSFPENLTGVMLDRFGKDVLLRKDSDAHYSIRTEVAISGHFFGWLAGLGKQVKIVSPDSVREQYKLYLSDILEDIL